METIERSKVDNAKASYRGKTGKDTPLNDQQVLEALQRVHIRGDADGNRNGNLEEAIMVELAGDPRPPGRRPTV